MRYGIDARLYGPEHTGIGRYVQNLIINLGKIDKKNTFIIFGPEKIKPEFEKFPNFEFVKLNTKVYSWQEQLINPLIFSRAKLDLLHVPHFNAPIFYPGKLALTIHDLIKHLSKGKKTTTLPDNIYHFKHLFYRLIVYINLQKAQVILTPSNYWKNYLIENYHLNKNKIFVTYEAVDKKFFISNKNENILDKYHLTKPFLIYTGNLYPHKNVNTLVEAVKNFNQEHTHQLQLAIVCSRSIFQNTIKTDEDIKILGFVPDTDLHLLYRQALALVQPSFIEGFGLTGLEAMVAGLPVISSNATCLPEIYGPAALYFDPYDQSDLIKQIHTVMTDQKAINDLISKGRIRVKQFSWFKMAKETLSAYSQSF
jgi:glycosyltransferase involved in cell wall biosynthesis